MNVERCILRVAAMQNSVIRKLCWVPTSAWHLALKTCNYESTREYSDRAVRTSMFIFFFGSEVGVRIKKKGDIPPISQCASTNPNRKGGEE